MGYEGFLVTTTYTDGTQSVTGTPDSDVTGPAMDLGTTRHEATMPDSAPGNMDGVTEALGPGFAMCLLWLMPALAFLVAVVRT